MQITLKMTDQYIINKSTVNNLKTLNFNFAGIYILYDVPDSSDNLINANKIYVGKSKNIIQRIKNHTVKLPYVYYIAFYQDVSQGIIDALEDCIIKICEHLFHEDDTVKILNSEQTIEEIDILLTNAEHQHLLKYTTELCNTLFTNLDTQLITEICYKHKKENNNNFIDLIQLGVYNAYASSNILQPGYQKLNLENSKLILENSKNIRFLHTEHKKYVFISSRDINSLLADENALNALYELKNYTFVHVGTGKDFIINGSEELDWFFLSMDFWRKQRFSSTNFLGDGFEFKDEIDKIAIPTYTIEDYLQKRKTI